MTYFDRLDAISLDALQQTGASKWALGEDRIGAFVAEMDFGTAPVISEALHRMVDEAAFGYMPRRFLTELADATAEWIGTRYRWPVAPRDVWALPDVIQALEIAIRHMSRPGSKVIVPTPAYMPFLTVPGMLGREVIEVPMAEDDGRPVYDLDALQHAYDSGGHLLVLCNPYNPLGRVFERDELLALSALVARNDGRVFADEIWAPLVYDGHTHLPFASIDESTARQAVTAVSASKAWNLPGLKCAQLITSNGADRAVMEQFGHFAGHGTANPGAVANAAAYRGGAAWLADTLAYLGRNRQALAGLVAENLPGVRYREPEGTYVGWLDFSATPIADNPAAFFKAHAGVNLTEGTACGGVGAGHVRFIFATPLPIMQMALRRMGAAMRGA